MGAGAMQKCVHSIERARENNAKLVKGEASQ